MHELPATQGMLEVALEAARGVGARRVLAIDLVVGELSTIVDDSVQFYFDILSRDTPAAGARLNFRRTAAWGECATCGRQWDVLLPLDPECPTCGSPAIQVTGGREFLVESIEVEDESSGGEGDSQGERPGRG